MQQQLNILLQTVAELGVVIFTALDYGLKDEEERHSKKMQWIRKSYEDARRQTSDLIQEL